MAKPNNRTMTLNEIGAQFGMTDMTIRYHVLKLVATGDVMLARPSRSQSPALYSLTSLPPAYVGQTAPAFKRNIWTSPLTGYEASLRNRAAMAMAARA